MPTLLDIAPSTSTVTVRGVPIAISGVSVAGLAGLIRRFPELAELLDSGTLSADLLFGRGPEVVAAAIAAGTGMPGDASAEAVAAGLGVADQVELLAAIITETFPQGVEGFLKRLAQASGGALQFEAAAAGGEAG